MKKPSKQIQKGIGRFLFNSLVLCFGIFLLFPFFWMLSTAARPANEVLSKIPVLIPKHITIQPFILAWKSVNFSRYYLNSVIVAVTSVCTATFFCSLGGYGFAKYIFFGKEFFFTAILVTLMVPWSNIVIPLYIMTRTAGLLDTHAGIIIPQMMTGFALFMMRQFISTVPDELIEAARIDGASEFFVYFNIILPLVKSALATVAIITFMWSWDAFLWPLIVISSDNMRTVPLGLASFSEEEGLIRYNQLMAAAAISMIPVVTVFVVLQRYIVRGIVMSGLKL
jgi:multiple sugar transport system permease protein